MTGPVRRTRWRGYGEYRDDTEAILVEPGDVATVMRGRPRSLLMKCPDGCGETLVMNLDPKAGKAWSVDWRRATLTVYPSVWRDGGCGSHFIIWRNHILWAGRFGEGNDEPSYDPTLEGEVLAALDTVDFRNGYDLAVSLDEIPWEINRVLNRLKRDARVEEGEDPFHQHFRRLPDK